MNKRIINEMDSITVHNYITNSDSTTVVTLSGLGHEDASHEYYLLKNNIDMITPNIIGITSKKRDFFINDDMNNEVESIKNIYNNVIVISHSMGGWAALKLGMKAKAGFVFLASPFLSLDKTELDLTDNQYTYMQKRLEASRIESQVVDKVNLQSLLPITVPLVIVADITEVEDKKSLDMLRRYNVDFYKILLPKVGHLSLYSMEEERILTDFIVDMINKNKIVDDCLIISLCERIYKWYLAKTDDSWAIFHAKKMLFLIERKKGNDLLDFFENVYDEAMKCEETERNYAFIMNSDGCIFSLSSGNVGFNDNPFSSGKSFPILFERGEQFFEKGYITDGRLKEINFLLWSRYKSFITSYIESRRRILSERCEVVYCSLRQINYFIDRFDQEQKKTLHLTTLAAGADVIESGARVDIDQDRREKTGLKQSIRRVFKIMR